MTEKHTHAKINLRRLNNGDPLSHDRLLHKPTEIDQGVRTLAPRKPLDLGCARRKEKLVRKLAANISQLDDEVQNVASLRMIHDGVEPLSICETSF
jgi:hypothetical protein